LAKCWNIFFPSNFFYMIILWKWQVYDYTVKMASIWLYCENGKYMIILWKWQVYDYTVKMSSRNIFFSLLCSQIFFFKIQNQNIFLGKNHIKLKLISLRGKLIKQNCKTKWFSHQPKKKRNKTVVIRKSHEKIFPSTIRLFYFSKLNLC
jgi:hypothetical protein